jgi:hypothetical protein
MLALAVFCPTQGLFLWTKLILTADMKYIIYIYK